MPKIKLTALSVARLAPPKSGQVDYFDTSLPAFGVRLSHAGTRSYFVMTRINGKLSRLTIGKAKLTDDGPGLSLADARQKAGELTNQASTGIDPRQFKKAEKAVNAEKAANTFSVVAERFMRQHAEPHLAVSTVKEYRWALQGKDTKPWANRPVSAISRADVRELLDGMLEEGRGASANKMLAYLSKFFNWSAEKDLIQIPPTDRIKKPAPKVIGERTLNAAEVAEVWGAFDAEGGIFGDLFKLLLLTGQRRCEVSGMRLGELTGTAGAWTSWEIPRDRTKNSRPHLVPLSPQMVKIIDGRPEIGDAGLLFSATGATPASGFSRAKRRIDKAIAEARKKAGQAPMPDWDLHDLRRTMVTMMNENLGIAPHVVEACVNHVSGLAKAGVAGVYNKALYLEERRRAMDAWGNYVERLVTPGKDAPNVVNLRG